MVAQRPQDAPGPRRGGAGQSPAPEPRDTAASAPWKVSFKGLLLVYAILPLCGLAYVLDTHGFDGHLVRTLPVAPES